jgi:hypothetical protein
MGQQILETLHNDVVQLISHRNAQASYTYPDFGGGTYENFPVHAWVYAWLWKEQLHG